MSALLRRATGAPEAIPPPPMRTRNDSTQGLGLEDPAESAMNKSLFANAVKAIRQGQPELLEMFLKKHPEIATAKGPIEREGGTKVRTAAAVLCGERKGAAAQGPWAK